MENNKIVKVLKSILENKKERKNELEENQKLDSIYKRLTFIINNVLNDPSRLKKIDLDSPDFEILNISEKELTDLKALKLIINNQVELDSEQKEIVNQIFNKYNEILKKLKENITYDSDEYIGLCLEIPSLENLISILQNSYILGEVEIDDLCNFLTNNLDSEEALELISEYAYNMTSSYEESNTERKITEIVDTPSVEEEEAEEEKIVEVSGLNRDAVVQLFKEFGIDFNRITEYENEKEVCLYQTEICKYGNLDNIRGILELFKKYNIDIVNNNLIEERSGTLAKIFTLSSTKLVSSILEYIVEDLKRNNDYNNDIIYKVNSAFQTYLKVPGFFVAGKIKYETGKGGNGGSGDKGFFGSFQNLEPLRNFFISIGVKDFNKLIKSSSKIFTRGYRTIISNYQKLLSYNVPTYKIIEDASCLHQSNAIDVFDQFIEAGFKEYIDNCLSAAQYNINDKRLIQMINAKRIGWSMDGVYGEKAIFRKQNKGETSRLIRQDKMLSTLKSDNLMDEPMYKVENANIAIDSIKVYGFSNDVLENEFIIRLEENFKTSEYTYHFNEIIISRYKVLRLFNYLIQNGLGTYDNLKNVIFKNTILTETEYDIVLSLLEEKVKNAGETL